MTNGTPDPRQGRVMHGHACLMHARHALSPTTTKTQTLPPRPPKITMHNRHDGGAGKQSTGLQPPPKTGGALGMERTRLEGMCA